MSEISTITMSEKAVFWMLFAAATVGYWATRGWDFLKQEVEA